MDRKTKDIIQPQNGKELISSLGILSEVPKVITEIAGRADRLAYGGKKRRKRRIRRVK